MLRELADGYELDDDPARIDLVVVHAYLSEEGYWSLGRSRETVERLHVDAAREVGVYLGDELVGYCRIASDDATYAFLFDVFVLEEHRGRGLGTELVREAVDLGPQRDLPWFLGTRDAHGVYERFGFVAPDERQMYRPGGKRP